MTHVKIGFVSALCAGALSVFGAAALQSEGSTLCRKGGMIVSKFSRGKCAELKFSDKTKGITLERDATLCANGGKIKVEGLLFSTMGPNVSLLSKDGGSTPLSLYAYPVKDSTVTVSVRAGRRGRGERLPLRKGGRDVSGDPLHRHGGGEVVDGSGGGAHGRPPGRGRRRCGWRHLQGGQ